MKIKVFDKKNVFIPLLAGAVIVLAAIMILKGKLFLPTRPGQYPTATPKIERVEPNSKTENLGNGLIRYTSYGYGFELTYPDYFDSTEYPEAETEQIALLYRVPVFNPEIQKDPGFIEGILIKITYLPSSRQTGYYSLPFDEIINVGEEPKLVKLRYVDAYRKKEPLRILGGTVYFIKRDKNSYYELWVVVKDPNSKSYQKVLDEILNSFKVID